MSKLVDSFGRHQTYLRISVTGKCNLQCRYCMPEGFAESRDRTEILSFEEFEFISNIFVGMGVEKIRLTGGEPLVRKRIEDLCRRLSNIPALRCLALSTNGVLLPDKAKVLREAGVQQLNISLDSLREEQFTFVTQHAHLMTVVRGIETARHAGFEAIKINVVVMKGFNDDELPDFVEFAGTSSVDVRFIEYMPFLGNRWSSAAFISFAEMKKRIETVYTLRPLAPNGPETAVRFQVQENNAVIGFITTMSKPFCRNCNRLRLTADGKIRNCLFARDGADLKNLLRSGAGREEIEDVIQSEVKAKWSGHPDTAELAKLQDRAMVAIGG
ncbi:MAG: GTP 3',8-cyclase MoaA [Ignavibacteriales bacterium]|nr:GTP 3',8-cyclase MoaA [Ignavibacteriales bacterium]